MQNIIVMENDDDMLRISSYNYALLYLKENIAIFFCIYSKNQTTITRRFQEKTHEILSCI